MDVSIREKKRRRKNELDEKMNGEKNSNIDFDDDEEGETDIPGAEKVTDELDCFNTKYVDLSELSREKMTEMSHRTEVEEDPEDSADVKVSQ